MVALLSEVQKASRESIETLVRSSEEIISNERTSWMSISSTKQVAEDKEGDEDVERGGKREWHRAVVP